MRLARLQGLGLRLVTGGRTSPPVLQPSVGNGRAEPYVVAKCPKKSHMNGHTVEILFLSIRESESRTVWHLTGWRRESGSGGDAQSPGPPIPEEDRRCMSAGPEVCLM